MLDIPSKSTQRREREGSICMMYQYSSPCDGCRVRKQDLDSAVHTQKTSVLLLLLEQVDMERVIDDGSMQMHRYIYTYSIVLLLCFSRALSSTPSPDVGVRKTPPDMHHPLKISLAFK